MRKSGPLPTIQSRLLGPLFGLLLGLASMFGYLSWTFRVEYSALARDVGVNSEVNRHVVEVTRLRARMQEVLLLYRLNNDPTYVTELTSLSALRSSHLDRVRWHAGTHPTLRSLGASLVGGLDEASFLQDEMVHAIQARSLKRADEAFRQLSTIFEINSARLQDFSLRLQSELQGNQAEMQTLVIQIFWMLASAVGLVAVTILLIALFYRRHVLRPLQTLHNGLRALAHGDMQSQIVLQPAPRELHEMGVDFNSMVTALATSQDQLTRAREDALQAARIKSDFLANMSHEIRTPMNAIIGMSDVLAEADLSTESRRHLQVLRNSGRVLLNVVNDILDFSRLESGKFTLESVPFDLRDLAARVSEVVAILARRKGLEYNFHFLPEAPYWVQGDSKRIEQIILNLLGNAVKFTDKGRIDLELIAAGEAVRMRFADTGIGIPPDRLSMIFARFSQSDTSITRRYGGTGLGLAIVKQLVDLMGGDVSVTSEMGKGTEFLVTLTLPRAEAPPPSLAKAAPAPAPLNDLEGRVLLVDDSPDNRMLIQTYLKRSRCTIQTAENGEQAVELYRNGAFDVVLMDMQMPILDGYGATSRIRDIEREQARSRTPIVALTAYALATEVSRSLKAGCDEHLTKPILKTDLLQMLQRFIAKPAGESLQ